MTFIGLRTLSNLLTCDIRARINKLKIKFLNPIVKIWNKSRFRTYLRLINKIKYEWENLCLVLFCRHKFTHKRNFIYNSFLTVYQPFTKSFYKMSFLQHQHQLCLGSWNISLFFSAKTLFEFCANRLKLMDTHIHFILKQILVLKSLMMCGFLPGLTLMLLKD